eukprot:TRINITY_DN917_c0_g1_i3.p1 TRINITY_DN917_c0_g1~~TRINITY_DN917_c0_g1_i3.p1  ORF type:complete len:157 (+),score=12.92 TRINITY_DN917_c0_g1_i3:966-1436(+)
MVTVSLGFAMMFVSVVRADTQHTPIASAYGASEKCAGACSKNTLGAIQSDWSLRIWHENRSGRWDGSKCTCAENECEVRERASGTYAVADAQRTRREEGGHKAQNDDRAHGQSGSGRVGRWPTQERVSDGDMGSGRVRRQAALFSVVTNFSLQLNV